MLAAGGDRVSGRAATRLAWVTLAVTGAVLVGAVVVLTGGTFTYPLDDPAIHLTVARRFVHDGTWGVVAGQYQAASSSPLWTLILAPTQWLVRGAAGELVPVALNVLAGLWVIRLLRDDLGALGPPPGADRPRFGAAAPVALVTLVVVLLYLPALTLMGMEHTLHMAVVLAAALAVEARWVRPAGGGDGAARPARWPAVAPFALLALAAATRGESAFVAVGLGVGLLAVGLPGGRDPSAAPASRARRWRAVAGLGATVAGALLALGLVNLAFGQEILPNSVVLKSLGDRGDTRRSPAAAVERLWSDPWLATLAVVAAVVVAAVLARSRRGPAAAGPTLRPAFFPAFFPAVVTLVAVLLHVELGAVDASYRYQAYLYGLGAWTALRALPGVHAALGHRSPRWRRLPAAVLLLAAVPLAAGQARATVNAPRQAEVTWEQRYQVAQFLRGAYRHDPIAVGELGYIGLYHDGPLTDVYGLGDHEVLTARMAGRKDAAFWHELQRRRGFRVAVTYAFTLAGDTPADWIPVADWRSPDAHFPVTRFWATVPGEVVPLMADLRAYESSLPDEVEVTYNELAPLGAAFQEGRPAGGTGQ
ncbi:MAG TPA: hypothetical protein VFI47_10475 [Acidimicrobiales bacterium]|nr:hypothetical protein [Acidimicrobiales bacterium]